MKFSRAFRCLLCLMTMAGSAIGGVWGDDVLSSFRANSQTSLDWNGVGGTVAMTDGTSPESVEIVLSDTNGVRLTSTTPSATGVYWINYCPPATYLVSASRPGYCVSPVWGSVEVTGFLGGFAGPDFRLSPIVTISGVLKDKGTGQPIRNGIVQAGGRDSQPAITDATGAFSVCAGRSDCVEVFADAPGYRSSSLVISATASANRDIELTSQAETGVIVNGGFEDVVDGKPVGWQVWDEALGSSITTTTDCAGGSYAAKVTTAPGQLAIAWQDLPVIPGSVYNIYYKLKSDADVLQVHTGVEFSRGEESLALWSSMAPDLSTMGPQTPLAWTQFLSPIRFSGSLSPKPLVRAIVPPTATSMRVEFGLVNGAMSEPRSIYIDDVVIDRVEPDALSSMGQLKSKTGCYVTLAGPATVTCSPQLLIGDKLVDFFYLGEKQGLGGLRVLGKPTNQLHTGDALFNVFGFAHKLPSGEPCLELISDPIPTAGSPIRPLGMTCRSVLTDPLAQTNLVRVWGKISYKTGWSTFTITDGYKTPVTVRRNFVHVPDNLDGKIVGVTGIVSKDDDGTPVLLLSEPILGL